jgi:hypothetical protein
MKTNTLIQLPKFDYSSLDFETIIDDVKRLILEHPEYYENWDDFLETDAGRMLIEMNAFIMEKFTSKLDWIAREMFIGSATRRQSQINILQLINYKPKLPSTSYVNISLTLAKWQATFDLPNLFSITGTDTNGANTSFECIEMADDGKPNYNFVYTVNTGDVNNKIREIHNIPFYQGTTRVETEIYMDGVSNERYQLQSSPVIEKSIRVFSDTTGKECVEVDSFISPEAQQPDVAPELQQIPYMVKIDANNNAEIIFGHSNIVNIPEKGEKFRIIYRIGGGSKTNIVKGAISTTKTLNINGNRVTCIFTNPQKAFGGTDGESIEEAKLTAPLSLRTANKTVTNEDYVIHLEDENIVKRAKIVSKENETEEIYEEYGHFLPPLDTWIYIIPQREGLDDMNPLEYNKSLKLTKPYVDNGYIDYEDIQLTSSDQTVFAPKLREYQFYTKHVCLIDVNGVNQPTFVDGVDFTIDYTRSEFTRIQSADGGTIPAGDAKLRILYVKNETNAEFESKCFRKFSSGIIVLSDNSAISLNPKVPVVIMDKFMNTTYTLGTDYEINWQTNIITYIPSGGIDDGDDVFVTYADYWDESGVSEEGIVLDSIKNKKMLVVDNHMKDTLYNTFDLVATVYCYKNLKYQVQESLPDIVRSAFNIDMARYDYPVSKAEIIALMMTQPGVRFAEIEYLGRDYATHRRSITGDIDSSVVSSLNADKVEHKIVPRYNEILVLAWDEYDGIEVQENQRHGLLLKFVEM